MQVQVLLSALFLRERIEFQGDFMKKKGLSAVLLSAVLSAVLFLCAAIRPTAVGSTDDTKPVKAIFEGAKIIIQKEVIVDPEDPENPGNPEDPAEPSDPKMSEDPETSADLEPVSADIATENNTSSEPENSSSDGNTSSSASDPDNSSSSPSSEPASSSGSSSSSSETSGSSADSSTSSEPASSSGDSSSSSSSGSSEPEKEPEKIIVEEIVDAPDNTVYYDNLTEAMEDIEAAGAKEAVVIIEGGVITDEPYSTVNISSGNISLFLNGGGIGADISVSENAILDVTSDDSFPTISLTKGTFAINADDDFFEITSDPGAGVSVPTASRDFALVTEDVSYMDDPETLEDEAKSIRKTYAFRDFTAPEKSGNSYYYRYESTRVTSESLLINDTLPDGISGIMVKVLRVPENAGFTLRNVSTIESRITLSAADGIASAANGVNSSGTARDYYFGEPLIHLAVADSEAEDYQLKDSDGNVMLAKAFCPDYLYVLSGTFTLTDVVWNTSSGHMTNVFAGNDDVSVSYRMGSASTLRTWLVEGRKESLYKDVYWLCDEDGVGNFYTTYEKIRDSFISDGFEDRGIAWRAPIKSDKPVYMVLNENSPSEYFYTTDKNEYNDLLRAGWKGKGIAFYASTETNMYPVYRQYNKKTGRHNFTSSIHEKNVLVSEYGWTDEGVAWFAEDLPFLK